MKTVVFIKQVPDTDDVKWTKDNNIDRSKMESILNPCDDCALELALQLKEKYKASVTAVTMGPGNATAVLKDAIAKGADESVLLCDSKFAASDTCATSRVLTKFIKEKMPDIDLIIFGQSAADGETGQTGPSVATRLNLPFVSSVKEIVDLNDKEITVISETETTVDTYKIQLPAAIFAYSNKVAARIPNIEGYMRAHDYNYLKYNLYELSLDIGETGLKGSPTKVCKVFRATEGRNAKIIATNTSEDYASEIVAEIKKGSNQ